jgi:hypothetical protein
MNRHPLAPMFSALLSTASLAAPAWSACPDPGPNQVVIWKDGSFSGTCKTLELGSYATASAFSPVPDESISSIKVGANVRVVLSKDPNFGGEQSLYESGSYAAVGRNENDKTSSIRVTANGGSRATFRYLGSNPNLMMGGWATEVQGLAHSDAAWYITQSRTIWQFDIGADLLSDSEVRVADMPPVLTQRGCDHYGDAHFANGYLLVPVEGCSDGPTLAVFSPDLELVCYDQLYRQSEAAWVAVHPGSGLVYSSRGALNAASPVLAYTLDWSQVYPDANPHWILWDPPAGSDLALKRQNGTDVDFYTAQGGVFSADGKLLYLTNGYYDCSAGTDKGGLRVFDAVTGQLIAKAGNAYGYFDYENHCGFYQYEEPQGLDYVDMDVRPGPYWGQLHALLLKNWVDGDQVYLKHYSQN